MKGLIPFITVASKDATSIRKATADYYCNGSADDIEINLALADAEADGGGLVFCSPGSYSVTGTIVVPSNTTLEFAPGSLVTVPTVGMALDITQLKNGDKVVSAIRNKNRAAGDTRIRIVGATIDFAGTGKKLAAGYTDASWAGIWLDNCTFSSIEQCKVYDVVADVSLTYRAWCLLLSDCSYSFMRDCIANKSGYEGAALRGNCLNCFIDNLQAQNNYAHLAQIAPWTPTITGDPNYCKITNSRCTDPATDATDFILHSYNAQTNNAIIGCTAANIRVRGAHNGALISNNNVMITIQISDDNLGKLCKRIIISNNLLHCKTWQSDEDRILIAAQNCASGGTITDVLICNNIVYGGRIHIKNYAGIPTSVTNVTIENNAVELSGASQASAPIVITQAGPGTTKNIRISGNTIKAADNQDAIDIFANNTGPVQNVQIRGNNIPSGLRGVKLHTPAGQTGTISHVNIENNTVFVTSSFVAAEVRASKITLLNNHILYAGFLFSGPGDKWFINGNVIDPAMGELFTGGPTNVQFGLNYGQIDGLWQLTADTADLDKMYIQQYNGAAYETLETWDQSP